MYSISQDGACQNLLCLKPESVISELKWAVIRQNHYLLLGTIEGNLICVMVEVENGSFTKFALSGEMHGRLKIPISNIEVVQGKPNVFICTKAHSLEIFTHSKRATDTSVQYIGCSITGITRVHLVKPAFMVITLSNKMFYMTLTSTGQVKKFEKIENSSQDVNQSHYGAYGITSSKNKALIFVALYPNQVCR